MSVESRRNRDVGATAVAWAGCQIRGPLNAPEVEDFILPLGVSSGSRRACDDGVAHAAEGFGDAPRLRDVIAVAAWSTA